MSDSDLISEVRIAFLEDYPNYWEGHMLYWFTKIAFPETRFDGHAHMANVFVDRMYLALDNLEYI